MALKSPGILTFMLSVILTVLALVTKFYPEANIPFVATKEFIVLLIAQVVLVFGCIMRGL
jgi:heme/copper-type cytochrome/quinol oxidase subunit 4